VTALATVGAQVFEADLKDEDKQRVVAHL